MSWNIVNVVATADLLQNVDIQEIAQIPHTIHDMKIYGGRVTYLKTPEMYGKVTIFPSGKLISVGTKSLEQTQHDLSLVSEILANHKFIKPTDLLARPRNIVALASFNIEFNLEDISVLIGAMYEPEQFPGAILKMNETNATYLIFQSGKVIISGTSSIEKLELAFKTVKNLLLEHSDSI
jgi:transcription initiation factor TFIID TATA-box-binding protein